MSLFGGLFRDKSRDDEFCRFCESESLERIQEALNSWGSVDAKSKDGREVLVCACEHNRDPEVITLLINNGARGYSAALISAVKTDNLEAAKVLVRNMNASAINEKDSSGRTALHYAVQDILRREMFELLINAGADIDTKDNEYKTLLMKFAGSEQDNSHMIKYLAEKGAKLNEECSHQTPLMMAIEAGNMQNINALIDAGADLNKAVSDDTTALFFASGLKTPGAVDIVKLLLARGADVDAFKKGEFALDHALNSGNNEIADLLRAAGGIRNFYKLCMDGTAQEVLTELKTGRINVNVVYSDGRTPLMISLHNKDIDVFKLLIEAGANINACAKFFPKGMCSVLDMAKIMQVSPFGAMKQRVNILRSLGARSLHPEIWK